MHPIFPSLSETELMILYRYILKRTGKISINKIYNEHVIESISVRELSESNDSKALITVKNDLAIEFDETRLNSEEQNNVIRHLTGNGFPIIF